MNNRILKSLSDAVVVVNSSGIIEEINDSVINLFLYDSKEMIGQPLTILMPERHRVNHDKIFKGLNGEPIQRRMGQGKGFKFVAQAKNGFEFYIDIALSSYYNEEGDIRYVALIRDISDLIEIRESLEETVDELGIKNKELEHFAYIVSHDLKAPARATNQLIQIIEEDHIEELSKEVLEYFQLIKQRSGRMSELIDGILSYSRAGSAAQEITEFGLKSLLEEITETLHIPDAFKVTFNNCNQQLNAQKTQFSQVLANLIGNAVKYHHKDSGNIEVSFNQTIDEIEMSVKDDGAGIPEKYHKTIFEMFGTANETSRTDSTGIGLAIVKKIINRNGGSVFLKSEVGKGSEFIFTWKKIPADK